MTFAGGLAVVEAEDHDAKVAARRQGLGRRRRARPARSARRCRPRPTPAARITTSIATTSPELGYRVLFPSAGTHQLWLRVYGISNGNTLHAGLDGAASAQNVTVATGAWRWVKATVSVPSAGEHTVHVWMREDGLHLDRAGDGRRRVRAGRRRPGRYPREDPEPDTTPPAVTGRGPAPGAVDVALGASVAGPSRSRWTRSR